MFPRFETWRYMKGFDPTSPRTCLEQPLERWIWQLRTDMRKGVLDRRMDNATAATPVPIALLTSTEASKCVVLPSARLLVCDA